jgi:hypothetical protein
MDNSKHTEVLHTEAIAESGFYWVRLNEQPKHNILDNTIL